MQRKANYPHSNKTIIGWREWLALPELGIKAVKAKIDSGARTSALHAFDLKPFESGGILKVKFGVHPLQRRKDIEIHCVADVVDRRRVTSSDGQSETRFVIRTLMQLGESRWPIELTLTSRKAMRFRMLLGRKALNKQIIIDPARSYLSGRELARRYPKPRKEK